MTRGLPYQQAGARNVMIMAWCFEEKSGGKRASNASVMEQRGILFSDF